MVMTAMLSAMITGCGCQKADEVSLCTPDSAATADSVPAVTYSKEEQAVLDENLSIDAAGNVTDGSGKQLKVGEDGKVEVKKSDGTVVKVDPDTVRDVRQQAESAESEPCEPAVSAGIGYCKNLSQSDFLNPTADRESAS